MGSVNLNYNKSKFQRGVFLLSILTVMFTFFLSGCQNDQVTGIDGTADILEKGKPKFRVQLSGANEVPGPGDTDGSGVAVLFINEKNGTVTFELNVADIFLPATGAHIHNAAAGNNGSVVVFLIPPDENGYSSGVVNVNNPDLLQDIKLNPQNYYVNVHNADFPAGAIRGQLK